MAPLRERAPEGFSAPYEQAPYERQFAAALGGQVRAFAFWKGRVALYAILRAMGIGPGDEVIVPGFTCVVVPNAVRLTGATPIYVDIEPDGFNIYPEDAEKRVTRRTKAILLQHTFGISGAVDTIVDLARSEAVRVIEDCAHTAPGTDRGLRLGTLGDASFFSFQWSKSYTTGLGGMAVTGDPFLSKRLASIQSSFVEPPRGTRMRLSAQYLAYRRFFSPRRAWLARDILNAASRLGFFVGSSSEAELVGEPPADHTWRMARAQQIWGERLLPTVDALGRHSKALAARYDDHLTHGGWHPTARTEEAVLLRYPVLVENRDALLAAARRERIELGSWFESPLHPLPLRLHERFGYVPGTCPRAERVAQRIVNLPLHAGVTPLEAERIAAFFLTHARPTAT